MKSALTLLLHWWRLLVEPSGAGRLLAFQPHRWRVRYHPDPAIGFPGGYSIPMAYDVASNYASHFGGVVERVRKRA